MKKLIKGQKTILSLTGMGVGLINGLFGAGGGMLAAPVLRSQGLEQAQAQATALAVIWPLSVMSALGYISGGAIGGQSLWVLAGSAPGGLMGAWLLGKLSPRWLSRILAAFMVFSGARMLLG